MFTKSSVEKLRDEVESVVSAVGRANELNTEVISVRYNSGEVKISLRLSRKFVDGAPLEQVLFEERCHSYGFEPEDYRKKIRVKTGKKERIFSLVGFNPRARKYPIIAKDEDGREYTMSAYVAKRFLVSDALDGGESE